MYYSAHVRYKSKHKTRCIEKLKMFYSIILYKIRDGPRFIDLLVLHPARIYAVYLEAIHKLKWVRIVSLEQEAVIYVGTCAEQPTTFWYSRLKEISNFFFFSYILKWKKTCFIRTMPGIHSGRDGLSRFIQDGWWNFDAMPLYFILFFLFFSVF